MYLNDSFFTLGIPEAAGLVALTVVLALGLLAMVRRLCWGRLWQRMLWAVGLFWLFLWLSPQVYYTYFQLIIDGLPVQAVVGWPPGGETVLRRLSFTGPASLAAHGQGILGWLVILLAVRRKPLGLGTLR